MGEHVLSVHQIPREDEQYEHFVKSAPVVPICYVKNAGGKETMMEGEDLREAMEENEKEVQKQDCLGETKVTSNKDVRFE